MATTTLYAQLEGKADKYASGTLILWVNEVRNATSATFVSTYGSSTINGSAFKSSLQSSRGGVSGQCNRTFLFFNNFGTGVAGNSSTSKNTW